MGGRGAGGGRNFQKLSQLGEVPKFLLERKMTLKIAGGVKFSLLLCVGGGGVKFSLLHFDSSVFGVCHARFSC